MRKQIFTVLAALGGLVCVHAANVTVSNSVGYAGLKNAIDGASPNDIVKVEVGLYIDLDGDGQLIIPTDVTVIGGFSGGFADTDRIYPGAATSNAELTILDANSLRFTKPAEKHRVAEVNGTLEGVVIRNGHVRGNGGGVLVNANGVVQNCIIKGNVAMTVPANDGLGGGAYLNGGKLINCVVAFNMANNGYGVAGNGEVINNTISANTYAPVAVSVTGGTYKHYISWINQDDYPWVIGESAVFDSQDITISPFELSQTETTTSQYAVFAAAMDLTVNIGTSQQEVVFSDASIILSDLIDPSRNEAVGTYMGFTSDISDFLFLDKGQDTYGLQKVGNDFIYYPTRANEAMVNVTWHGSLAYCLWIGGTLPTEGQWEFAARSNGDGTLNNYMFAGSDVLNDIGWTLLVNAGHVREVATKQSNYPDGLYDMSGNVWEWCADRINSTDRTVYPPYSYGTGSTDPIWNEGTGGRLRRGAGWSNNKKGDIALAIRLAATSSFANYHQGFRPVLIP